MTISKNAIATVSANNEKFAELTQRLESLIGSTFKKTLQEFREENKNKVRQWVREEEENEEEEEYKQEDERCSFQRSSIN